MEGLHLDWIAILIAALLNKLIGFFWYSKWIFGPIWHTLGGAKQRVKFAHFWGVLVSLTIAFFLAFFEAYLGVTTVSDGVFVGFCVWLGFVFTTQLSALIWSRGQLRLLVLDTSCKLLSFLVMGGILGT